MIVSLTEHNLRWKIQIADFECNCRYIESANSLSKETNIDVNRYEVADNVDLETVLMDYESYYYMKFTRYPKIVKRLTSQSGKDTVKKSMKSLSSLKCSFLYHRQLSGEGIVFSHVCLSFLGGGGPHVSTTHDAIGQSQVTWDYAGPDPVLPDMLKLVQLRPHHAGSPSPGHVQAYSTWTSPHMEPPHAHTRLAGKRTVNIRLKCLLLLVYLKLKTKILFRYC